MRGASEKAMKPETPFEVIVDQILLGQPGELPTFVLKTTLQKPSADADVPEPRLSRPPPEVLVLPAGTGES